MTDDRPCPRCGDSNRDVARFCSQCGLALDAALGEALEAGRVRHPRPAAPPPGFVPCEGGVQLYYRWQPTGGGEPLSETESIDVTLFNAGYSLAEVTVVVRGEGANGSRACEVDRTISALPHAGSAALEIPSYEIAAPLRVVRVVLRSAQFAPEPESSQPGGRP